MLILIFMLFFTGYSIAQVDRKLIRQGNREYEKTRYSESEIFYRKAIDKNEESADAVFNSGDALYKQKKYEDAGKQFIETHKMNEDKVKKSASLYNLGNSFLMANKLQESIEAYKNSLKLKPDNPEAKYNLAYAQDLLRKQQQEQQQNNNKIRITRIRRRRNRSRNRMIRKNRTMTSNKSSRISSQYQKRMPSAC